MRGRRGPAADATRDREWAAGKARDNLARALGVLVDRLGNRDALPMAVVWTCLALIELVKASTDVEEARVQELVRLLAAEAKGERDGGLCEGDPGGRPG